MQSTVVWLRVLIQLIVPSVTILAHCPWIRTNHVNLPVLVVPLSAVDPFVPGALRRSDHVFLLISEITILTNTKTEIGAQHFANRTAELLLIFTLYSKPRAQVR